MPLTNRKSSVHVSRTTASTLVSQSSMQLVSHDGNRLAWRYPGTWWATMPLSRPKCTPPGVMANSGLPCKKIILPSTNDASPVPAMWPSNALRALPMWLGMLSSVSGMYLAPDVVPLVLQK